MKMKRIFLATLLVSIFSFTTFAQTDTNSAAASGKKVPSTEIKTIDGKTTTLQDYVGTDTQKGKITVISLWASWCKPCQTELDAIADLYEEWQEEYDMQLLAVTIDTRRALAKVTPIVEAKGWEYTILSDTNQALRTTLNFQSIPHTLLVDQNGNIVDVHSGYSPGDEYELEDKIKALSGK